MKKYVIALDEGTTSARSVLIDRAGAIVGQVQHAENAHVAALDPQLLL